MFTELFFILSDEEANEVKKVKGALANKRLNREFYEFIITLNDRR